MDKPQMCQDLPERAELKPERVQQFLLQLPGWKLRAEGRGIQRRRQFGTHAKAQDFVSLVGKLATVLQQPVTIALAGKRVDLILPGHPVKGNAGGLTDVVFNLAGLIG